jgi:hypothetical protein
MPILKGGGTGSHPTPNHVIRKGTVNAKLAMGHPGTLLEIYNIFHTTAAHQRSKHIIIFDWGKKNIARNYSRRYMYTTISSDTVTVHYCNIIF